MSRGPTSILWTKRVHLSTAYISATAALQLLLTYLSFPVKPEKLENEITHQKPNTTNTSPDHMCGDILISLRISPMVNATKVKTELIPNMSYCMTKTVFCLKQEMMKIGCYITMKNHSEKLRFHSRKKKFGSARSKTYSRSGQKSPPLLLSDISSSGMSFVIFSSCFKI